MVGRLAGSGKNMAVALAAPPVTTTLRIETIPSPTLRRVPIDAIFCAESSALKVTPERLDELRREYERCIAGIINGVRLWLGPEGDIEKVDERKLFKSVLRIFRRDLKTAYERYSMVATSSGKRKFNCYSGSVLLADALTRMGKAVDAVHIPKHVFLVGSSYAFETTAKRPRRSTYPRKRIDIGPQKWVGSVDSLLHTAYHTAGCQLSGNFDNNGALEASERAIRLYPKDGKGWILKAGALRDMGRFAESLAACKEAIALDQKNASAWNHVASILYRVGRFEEALKANDTAGKACTNREDYADVCNYRASILLRLDRQEMALEAYDMAIWFNRKHPYAWHNKESLLDDMGRLSRLGRAGLHLKQTYYALVTH